MEFLGLKEIDVERLQFEVISDKARLKLTRRIRSLSNSEDNNLQLLRQNRFVNIVNNVLGKPIYVLESDDMGDYQMAEHAWHIGQIELIMRLPNTVELVEILADMIQERMLDVEVINEILNNDGCSVEFEMDSHRDTVLVHVIPIEQIDEIEDSTEHPNIRKLIKRMDNALANEDYSGVLHTSASVFETLAKDVFGSSSVQNQSLGAFFNGYRNRSNLPSSVLDYILEIYNRRNVEPLAGHGSTLPSSINRDEAVVLGEMTKTFVRIERKLAMPQVNNI
ncbi:hypothetical protein KM918_19400 [Priestia megaterium]|uniref:hypothetical protein n=1 Tax=Priestia megaterium TaxID=1404 RepID=UPI001C23742E|nr:hypothetical protein [Priestia megaterium]MBU8689487.1 hypothetical protein [Priestia megaterium]